RDWLRPAAPHSFRSDPLIGGSKATASHSLRSFLLLFSAFAEAGLAASRCPALIPQRSLDGGSKATASHSLRSFLLLFSAFAEAGLRKACKTTKPD
ncbi:hypothetical protein JHJ32_22015, partial [Parapedobacter sp. ISTM3]|uniref:hypothetical protein n=1 Tax=Parapedobacter sp. ISTM3 TaxID=2800130 RepID=UPI0019075E59